MSATERGRVRLVLPLVQVVIALALKTSNALRPDLPSSPAWAKPDIQICHSLNAPIAVVTNYLIAAAYGLLPRPYPVELAIERVLYFGLVWLLWYAVSIEIGGNGQSILTPKTGVRVAADMLAFLFGAAVGAIGFLVRGQFGGPTVYSSLLAAPYVFWGTTIAAFYGHDLWLYFGRRQNRATDTNHSR